MPYQNFFFSLNTLLLLLLSFVLCWFAVWVFLADRKNKSSRYFFWMNIFILFWTAFAYICNFIATPIPAQFFAKLGYASASLFFLPFYFFSINFPRYEKKSFFINSFFIATPIIVSLVAILTNLLVIGTTKTNIGTFPILGEYKLVYFGPLIFMALFIVISILHKYFSLNRDEKIKVQYLLTGIFIFVAMNLIFNVFLAYWQNNSQYYQFANYSSIFLIGFTAYAIVKKQLFGIKVILTQLLVFAIALLLFFNVLSSQLLFEYVWKSILFLFFIFFGLWLIKSVMREIKQKEQINQYAKDLASANVELQNAYGKLQTLDKAKSEFISIASHQLRTPLTAIKGYISMLIEGDYGKISKEAARSMKNVYLANERLVKLVNSLLDMSRIEAGRIVLEFAPVKIDDLARDILREMRQEAQNKKLKLRLVKDKTELPKIMADKTKLRDGLLNLVDNAIKYTNRGEVAIKIKHIEQENKMQIIVQDTGEGMNQEEIDKLFRSFSRADSGKKNWAEGSGLGLYIAKKFIEMHHGSIYAESSGKGQGSRFVITLPIAQPNNK